MNKSFYLTVLIATIFSSLFISCNESNNTTKNSLTESNVVPATPDTSTYLKVANFLSKEEIASIVQEKLVLKNGKKRKKGIIPVPMDGDDFRSTNLDGIYWHEESVVEGDFRGATMRSAHCEKSNFNNSDFRTTDIRWTFFDHSDLSHSNFNQARLFHVHVNYGNLEQCSFRGTNMFGMEGHHAILRNSDMTNALMKDSEFPGADFTQCLFVNTRLIRAVMTGADFEYTNCSYADFSGGGLDKTNFKNALLKNVNFQGARLRHADFSGADLEGTYFYGAHLKETNFTGAKNIPSTIKEMMVEGKVTGDVLKRD